jgi:membrane-associated phospholipid phosphatase
MTNQKEKSFPLVSFPDKERALVFLTWGTAALAAFPVVYGLTNYLAGLNSHRYTLYFAWETQTPFIKEFVWLYLSLNVALFLPLFMCDALRLKRYCQTNLVTLLLAAAIFVLFPTDLGFARVIPTEAPFQGIFQNIHALDQPHNLVPSLHVTFSALAFFAVMETHRRKKWLQVFFTLWMAGIAASVVFTRQHHILDILGGLFLAFVGIRFVYLRREVIQNPQLTDHQQKYPQQQEA